MDEHMYVCMYTDQVIMSSSSSSSSSSSPNDHHDPEIDGKLLQKLMTKGRVFTQYMMKVDPKNPEAGAVGQKKSIYLFYKMGKGNTSGAGALYYLEEGAAVSKMTTRSIQLSTVREIRLGKQTPGFNSPEGSRADATHCFSLVSRDCSLDLEAPSTEVLRDWLLGIRYALAPSGRVISDSLMVLSASANMPTPQRPVRLYRLKNSGSAELDALSSSLVSSDRFLSSIYTHTHKYKVHRSKPSHDMIDNL